MHTAAIEHEDITPRRRARARGRGHPAGAGCRAQSAHPSILRCSGRGPAPHVLAVGGLLVLGAGLATSAAPRTGRVNPPNLIFILTDDQGIESMEGPAWWNPTQVPERPEEPWIVSTPALARFAEQGVSFTGVRVNANDAPTRAALMTGRSGMQTGVTGSPLRARNEPNGSPGSDPPPGDFVAPTIDWLSLQNQERTIAEVLQDAGYFTALVGKWDLGYNESESRPGIAPEQQGFDFFWDSNLHIRDHEPYADLHMIAAARAARNAIMDRPRDPSEPYALFFHTIMPRRLWKSGDNALWWEISPENELHLCPSTWDLPTLPHEDGYDPGLVQPRRFMKTLEAQDSVLWRYLLGSNADGLGVVDSTGGVWYYNPTSNTIIFVLSDNGTDPLTTFFPWGAKNTLHRSGINVPCFVFGENITGVPGYDNTINPRLISHVDFFDTIADIIGASDAQRNNPHGDFPRQSVSFADAINWPWGASPPAPRVDTLSSEGNVGDGPEFDQIWRVAYVRRYGTAQDPIEYKLVCNSGGSTFDDMTEDEFYLVDSVENAPDDLLVGQGRLTQEQFRIYHEMRDRVVDHWPTAVAQPGVRESKAYAVEHDVDDYVLVTYMYQGELQLGEVGFYNLVADPNRENNLCDGQTVLGCRDVLTSTELAIYNALLQQVQADYLAGELGPEIATVDLPLTATLVLTTCDTIDPGPLRVGHHAVGLTPECEYRSFLKFDPAGFTLPDGFDWDDAIDAQLIVQFQQDSVPWDGANPDTFFNSNDADTGVVRVYQVLTAWSESAFDQINETIPLGAFDPPPHIINAKLTNAGQGSNPEQVRVLPIPEGAPISFGHNQDLLNLVDTWRADPAVNHGVALIADLLPTLAGHQDIAFQRTSNSAVIRITLDRTAP